MTTTTESPELGDLADGIQVRRISRPSQQTSPMGKQILMSSITQELTITHPLNQKMVPIFCVSKISGYVQVYIKRVDSKEVS